MAGAEGGCLSLLALVFEYFCLLKLDFVGSMEGFMCLKVFSIFECICSVQ